MRALPFPIRRALRAALLAAVALLAACVEPVQTAGVGGEGTGGFGAAGRVDGFGSTFVEGQRLDDSDARVTIDGVAEAPLTAIKLGSQVLAQGDSARLLRAEVAAEVVGPLDADADETAQRFTVLGQRVLLAGHPAVRPAFDGVADLLAGTVVEVHGMRQANGDIVATRVQARAPTLPILRVRGPVSGYDAAARRFRLGGLAVSFAGAAVGPPGAALADGAVVTVVADARALNGGVLTAQSVRVDAAPADGELRLAGFVSDYASPASLRVRGQRVDASGARYAAGSSADLRNDALLRVRGRAVGGMLYAEEIAVLRSAADAMVDVTGPITDFSGADNVFRLRGANVQITPQTQFAGGTADNLGNGVLLRVTGSLVDGNLAAERLQWIVPSPVVAGTVSGYDAAAATLRLPPLATPVRLSPATVYRNGSAADLANGRRLRVTGSAGVAELAATEVTFLDAANAPLAVLLAGVSSDVLPGSRIFVNETPVVVDAQTLVTGGATGTLADLDGGQYLIVRALRINGTLTARSIDIRATLDDDFDNVIGYVSQFASLGDLRVAGQRVDARAATLAGGTAADLRDNAYVLVEGAVANGVLTARRIELLPN